MSLLIAVCLFLFIRYHIDYYKAVATQVDQQISSCLRDALDKLSQYQIRYQKYPENISESSKASLKLYIIVKKMAVVLKHAVPDRFVCMFVCLFSLFACFFVCVYICLFVCLFVCFMWKHTWNPTEEQLSTNCPSHEKLNVKKELVIPWIKLQVSDTRCFSNPEFKYGNENLGLYG